jgi:oligopeptide transport system substrate-binding protein
VTQEAAEFNRYRAGEVHITSSVPPENFDQIRADYADELHIVPTLGVYYYGFNMTKPPFADNPDLRQALSMAIDRDVLVEAITGRGEAPAYSWVPPGVENYEPVQLPYADLSRQERNAIAQNLYRKAGYSAENPARFELRYNTSDTQQRIALAVQAMWRNVLGAQAQIVNVEFQVLLDQMREREVTEAFRSSWFGDYNDANTFLAIMRSDSAANLPGYSNPEFDALMRSAGEQLDLDRRRLYLEEAERVLLADHVVIPLYFYVSKHLVKPEVEGWQDNILDYHYSKHLSLGAAEQDGRP